MQKLKQWFKGLSATGKVTSVAVASILSFGTIGTLAQPSPPSAVDPVTSTVAPVTKPQPKIETKTVTATEAVAFTSSTIEDGTIAQGVTQTKTAGVNGVRTITHEVTYTDGVETARTVTKDEVTTAPVNEVTALGTRVAYVPPPVVQRASNCDPNYTGCVPVASDVDCIGGSGNGPAYTGKVQVIGTDIYGLDRNGDGWGCE